jgi:signal transduction histidine kinase
MKIKAKIFLFIALTILVTLSIFTWVSVTTLNKEIRIAKIHEVAMVAKNKHNQLTEKLNSSKQNTQNLITRILLLCDSKRPDSSQFEKCVTKRLNVQLIQEHANGIIFRQRKNNLIFQVGNASRPEISKNDFLPGQLAVLKRRGSDNQSQPFYVMAEDSELGFEILVEYPLEILQNIFKSYEDLGKSGETFLADNEGYFITEMRYKSHAGLHHGISVMPMVTCLQKNNSEMLDLDYRAEPIIHGFQYVPEIGGGCIMAHVEQAEAFAPAFLMTKKIITFAISLFILLLPIIYYFASSFAKPLMYLTGLVDAVAKGDEEMQSQLRRSDEIGILSSKFNKMLLALKENRVVLEQQQQTIFESSKLNAMGEMAKGVAHEINSPLSTIILGADLIELKNRKSVEPNQEIAKLGASIANAADKIETIVKRLKGVSLDAITDDPSAFTVNQIIRSSVLLCDEKIRNQKISIEVNGEQLDTLINGNFALLTQSLSSLITNSCEALVNLEHRWIKLDATVSDNFIEIKIIDSGNGIPDELQQKIFRPMFTTKAVGSGLGLGLNFARSIITNFGGIITYDSTNDHTCFIMKWPYV